MNALPGEDLIEAGLEDLHAGRETIPALLVAIGSPRLKRLGLALPEQLPEHRLYNLLARDDQDSAHSRYNALSEDWLVTNRPPNARKELP